MADSRVMDGPPCDAPDGRLADPGLLRRAREDGPADVPEDLAFDRLVRLAAHITGEGVALLCWADSVRLVFPNDQGRAGPLDVDRQAPLSRSLSQCVVDDDSELVVTDAREYPALQNHPSVTAGEVVAYAGCPVHHPDGTVLGVMRLGESAPRVWSMEQLTMLRDLTALVETEIALRVRTSQAQLADERLRQVLASVVDTPVLAVDAHGVVTAINRAAKKLVGRPAASDGEAQDWLMVDGAGRTRVVSVRSTDTCDSCGDLDDDDVSSRRESRILLQEAARKQDEADERLTELDWARNVFIATASHELRTPVASILAYTELLTDGAAGSLTPEQQRLLEPVDRNSKRLLALIEDLLDLSRQDSRPATTTVVRAPLDANSAAEHAWEALKPHLAERGIRGHLDLCEPSPQILGDGTQVERALCHLLRNAVTFTPEGGTVTLSVRASLDGVEYEVADTGDGIAKGEHASVFEPFFRTRLAHSRATPGAGIGLAIVRRIAEAHGGQVHANSRPGIGTSVTIVLPAPTRDEAVRAPRPADAPIAEKVQEPTTLPDLEADLRLALEGSVTQFVMHYQPVVDLTSGKVVAVESLLRWQHPVHGLLHPDQFLALSEATGLVHTLGGWALDRVVQDAPALTHRGRELDVALNLCVRQVDDRLVAQVRRAVDGGGLQPERLVIEVTESAFVEDEETTSAIYAALSELGVKIAIDDFGTGPASLLHLRRHHVDALKIDRELVAGIGERPDDEAICRSIVDLAGAVGASTIGEGVETAQQHAVLRSLGCDRGQGSLWSPAVPVHELGTAFAACEDMPLAAPRSPMSRERERLPTEVTTMITTMQCEGASMHSIAAALNRTVGRHPEGMRWTAAAVAQALAAEMSAGRAMARSR